MKERLDVLLVNRNLAESREKAKAIIMAGIVYVDGEALEEPYTYTPTNIEEGMDFPLTVEENCVFAMGDNRNRSHDSRSRDIGLIDRREILGKAIYLFLPGTDEGHAGPDYERMGAIK